MNLCIKAPGRQGDAACALAQLYSIVYRSFLWTLGYMTFEYLMLIARGL